MLEHGGLRESALRTQERHFERLLLREAGRHDFAKQPRDLLVAQRPAIALERLAQHLRFALRTVEIHRLTGRGLRDADQLREARAFVEQRVNARIDGVDAVADIAEIGAAAAPSRGTAPARAEARAPPLSVGRERCFRGLRAAAAFPACSCAPHRVPALEFAHERDQRLDARERHGVVEARAHAARAHDGP